MQFLRDIEARSQRPSPTETPTQVREDNGAALQLYCRNKQVDAVNEQGAAALESSGANYVESTSTYSDNIPTKGGGLQHAVNAAKKILHHRARYFPQAQINKQAS